MNENIPSPQTATHAPAVPDEPELRLMLNVQADGKNKSIRFLRGDITQGSRYYDVLVCSAYKNIYASVPGTLISSLLFKGISVTELSYDRELDLSQLGAWMSKETKGSFSRIAVIELLEFNKTVTQEYIENSNLKGAFYTLRFLLEQAALRGIPVRKIILPILGTGNQKIDLNYIAAPLMKQCLLALHSIPELEEIDICDLNREKIDSLAKYAKSIVFQSSSFRFNVFISYSSKQRELANQIRTYLNSNGLSCWMAPDSIPPGSDYLEEIPIALGNVKAFLLVLTEDAMNSKWVKKEVATAVGSGIAVLPVKFSEFELNSKFCFLLDGEQIMLVKEKNAEDYLPDILKTLRAALLGA